MRALDLATLAGAVGIILLAAILSLAAPAAAAESCENASTRLAAASKCAVFELADAKVSASHGDPTGVDGNLCMAAESELSMSGGQIITGTAFLDPLIAKVPSDLTTRAGAVVVEDQSAAVLEVAAKASELDGLVCDVVFDDLKVDSSQTWNVTDFNPLGGEAVVCVDGEMKVSGTGTVLTLTGAAGDSFVFRVGEAFKVNGAKIVAAAPLSAGDLLYYLPGRGKDIAFSGGGGGLSCCKAAIDGTILAPERKIALSPGRVNGQVVSGRDISLSSGSLVSCPPGDGNGNGDGEEEGDGEGV